MGRRVAQTERMRSIELTFDTDTEAAFRAQWAALEAAGLPNLGRHQSSSNRPHITLSAGPTVSVTDALLAVFAPDRRALPIEFRVAGLVLFPAGHDRWVLARPVVMSDRLLRLHQDVADAAPGALETTQPNGWTPHVTLARRLTAAQLTAALPLLDQSSAPGTLVAARFWNGETKTLTDLG